MDVWEYRPEHHKTEYLGADRVIFIGPKGQRVLVPYLLRSESAYIFSPRESELRRQRKPRGDIKERYDRNSYRRAVYRAAERAGVPQWGPNRLRHSAGTEIRHQFGLEGAQVVLGHSAADVTQIYAERDADLARRVAAEVG